MSTPNIWYQYTPKHQQVVQADTNGSGFDTMLGVYTLSSGTFTQLDCDDDTGNGTQSLLLATLQAKTTYYFMVGGYDGTGSTQFNLTAMDSPAVTPKFSGTVDANGNVVVNATVSCRTGTDGYIDNFELTQQDANGNAGGHIEWSTPELSCGQSTTYEGFSDSATPFTAGKASMYSWGFFQKTNWPDYLYMEFNTAMRLASARG
jgi:hypothetical protein